MRCPVSSPQSTSVNCSHPPLSVDLNKSSGWASHFRHTTLAIVGHTVSLPLCMFGELGYGYAALFKPSFLFKWYVSFNSPYHEAVKHSWNASFTLEIISWASSLSKPQFCSFTFHLKVLYFHTRGVSFHEGILSTSQSAPLMVITLPDVSLLAMTPPCRALPSLNGPPCPN